MHIIKSHWVCLLSTCVGLQVVVYMLLLMWCVVILCCHNSGLMPHPWHYTFLLSHRVTPSTCCLPTMIMIQLVTMIFHNISTASLWSSTCLEILWSLHLHKISPTSISLMKMCVYNAYHWHTTSQQFTLHILWPKSIRPSTFLLFCGYITIP